VNPELHFAQHVVGTRSSSSDWNGVAVRDWAGVFKIAAVCAAAVGTYFVYRHVVVAASTVQGMTSSARGRTSS